MAGSGSGVGLLCGGRGDFGDLCLNRESRRGAGLFWVDLCGHFCGLCCGYVFLGVNIMLHVYSHDLYVASINKLVKGADNYKASEPWLLLHKTGRVDRFATLQGARVEARKSWPATTFSRT